MRRVFGLGLVAAAAMIGYTAVAGAADFTLNVNTALSTGDPLFKGLETFRDSVAQRSGGRLEVKLFPSSQLGKDEDVLEQARAGAPNAVIVDGGQILPESLEALET